MEYVPPAFEPPYRVMLFAAAAQGWYQAADDAERKLILKALGAFFDEWEERGARLLYSFDDDYFVTGQPSSLDYAIYVQYEVDSLDVVAGMIQRVREEVDGIRLDRSFRMEARVGRPLFLLDR
ncbi:MAG: hypothetical protein QOE91_74 [Gaiellaceae bacterium]|jgi:hypothetical protein|nr:hypothetical protein [Gaiellaceae bacterium]